MITHIVSVSGGKDSTATLILAMRQFPETTHAVFADTGNEHEQTYEYLQYLESSLGVVIHHLKQDFSEWWWRRRDYVRDKWPEKGVPDETIRRVLDLLEEGPTGNPMLDLCMIKGRFPSRMAQFCTQQLKTEPLTEFCLAVSDFSGNDVWSWQGVRRDESAKRSKAQGFEEIGPRLFAFRPIAGWSAQQTVDFVVKVNGMKLNPLYAQGMDRVGCMPCINSSKSVLAEISRRFPEHIERIAKWEELVSSVSKRGSSSWIPVPERDAHLNKLGIKNAVKWAKTLRGGKIADLQWDDDAPSCASSYGLCE